VAACGAKPPSFSGTAFDPPEPAPAVTLHRADGAPFSLRDQRGDVVLVFFGYTHCPDMCPTTLSDWARVRRALGDDARRVRFVFVSVDPARDTPVGVQAYAARFDSSFVGLTGDSTTLAALQRAFHVTSGREDTGSASGYAVTHASQTFVIDPRGRLRLLYSFGMPTDGVVSDIRTLLKGA
jgi:protein SCO1/2